jgi:hypothetical protein
MVWIDESLRIGFEQHERLRAANREDAPNAGELDRILPSDVRARALAIGNELILPYEDALVAIRIATGHQIAVLGFDSGEVLMDGFQVLDYTGYDRDIAFSGDWKNYVALNNGEAERWIKDHRLGKNHGYILTSTSQKEFGEIQK